MPLPRSLAPSTRNTTIMITALWTDMNCLIDANGAAARSPAIMKYSTGPATVSEPMMTNTATATAVPPPLNPAWAIDADAAMRQRQVLRVGARQRGAEHERLARGELVERRHELRHRRFLTGLRADPSTAWPPGAGTRPR